MEDNLCRKCGKWDHVLKGSGPDFELLCRDCFTFNPDRDSCRLFEYGHENPIDPKGSTAHIRDIRDRRWHPTEKRMFYYSKELGRTYFLPK